MDGDGKIPVFVRNLTGKQYNVFVDPKDKVLMMKYEIAQKYDIEMGLQKLIYCGGEMKNDCTIESYNLALQTTVHLIVSDEPSAPSSLIEIVFNMEIAFKKLQKKCQRFQIENASLKKELSKIKKQPQTFEGGMGAL